MSDKSKPIGVIASEVSARTKPSVYPEPFASRMAGRRSAPLAISLASQTLALTSRAWEHGLNLFEKDEALGITFICKAAESRFEGALQFIADAYENGKFGFPKDPQLATFWREKLQDDDVIRF